MTTQEAGYFFQMVVGLGAFLASLWLVHTGDTQSAIFWLLVALYMRVGSNERYA